MKYLGVLLDGKSTRCFLRSPTQTKMTQTVHSSLMYSSSGKMEKKAVESIFCSLSSEHLYTFL